MPHGGAGRIEHLDQPLERQILVPEGGQVRTHPPDQLAEGRLPRGVGAQHQRIDEEADQIVQRASVRPGDQAADRDVGACAQSAQQPRQRLPGAP